MSGSVAGMDAPLRAAVAAVGGRRALSRALGLTGRPAWHRAPRRLLFRIAELSGIAPQLLRPDLAEWIAGELRRAELAESGLVLVAGEVEARWDRELTVEAGLVDLWSTFAAVIFVARERKLRVQALCYARTPAAEAARAYAMGLAKVAGRASPTHIANIFGCARQNVDNAAERYLRSRDGDDPEDFIQGQFADGRPRVLEIGSNRLRLAKGADPDLWAAQQRFETFLSGEDLAAPPAQQRRRA